MIVGRLQILSQRLFVPILLWGLCAVNSWAATVAVLPFDDLTMGGNALNPAFTEEVRNVLRDEGVDLVPTKDIDAFLVGNQLRNTGYLDSLHAVQMCRQTGCNAVVVGTVTESAAKGNPAAGFTFTVLDGQTGSPRWGGTSALSLRECVGILGLGQPDCPDDFRLPLLKEALPSVLFSDTMRRDKMPPPYRIQDFSLNAAVLGGEESMECLLRLDFLESPASEIQLRSGAISTPFIPTDKAGVYRARWQASPSEGQYDLSLELSWDDSRRERLDGFAHYEVLNTVPPLNVALKNVRTYNQVSAVKDKLLLIPSVEDSRPLRHWSMAILNAEGVEVARTGKDGILPSRLVWEGKDKSNHKLADGIYEIVFDAWDYASNHSRISKKIIRQSKGLSINLATVVEDGQSYLQLSPAEAQIVPVERWTIRVTNAAGDILVNQKGEELPVRLPLSVLDKETHVICDVDVTDILGNRMVLEDQSVKLEKKEDQPSGKKGFSSWAWVEER